MKYSARTVLYRFIVVYYTRTHRNIDYILCVPVCVCMMTTTSNAPKDTSYIYRIILKQNNITHCLKRGFFQFDTLYMSVCMHTRLLCVQLNEIQRRRAHSLTPYRQCGVSNNNGIYKLGRVREWKIRKRKSLIIGDERNTKTDDIVYLSIMCKRV